MQHLRKASHCVYNLNFRIVWITKYRKPVLYGPEALRIQEIIRILCHTLKVEILKGSSIKRDYVELYVSVPPSLSISKLMQMLKGKTANVLLRESVRFQKIFLSGSLWATGYYVTTVINHTDSTKIEEYIENHEDALL